MTNKCLAVENSTIPCAIKNLKCHVLVAEDSRVAQALFYRILTEAGFDMTLVKNGLEAVDHAMEGNFDLSVYNLIESCLRDIFENPDDRNPLKTL